MKKSYRITALCIIFAMLVTVMPAIRTEAMESRMTYIISYSADLYISDSGEASITGYVRGKGDVTSTYDWYYTTLTAGNTYFLDLRNIGSTPNFNITLFYSGNG